MKAAEQRGQSWDNHLQKKRITRTQAEDDEQKRYPITSLEKTTEKNTDTVQDLTTNVQAMTFEQAKAMENAVITQAGFNPYVVFLYYNLSRFYSNLFIGIKPHLVQQIKQEM